MDSIVAATAVELAPSVVLTADSPDLELLVEGFDVKVSASDARHGGPGMTWGGLADFMSITYGQTVEKYRRPVPTILHCLVDFARITGPTRVDRGAVLSPTEIWRGIAAPGSQAADRESA